MQGLRCSLLDSGAPDLEDGSRCPGVELEIPVELVEGRAVGEPVEQLLDGQARTAEAGGSAHSTRVDSDDLLQRHRWLSLGFRERFHDAG